MKIFSALHTLKKKLGVMLWKMKFEFFVHSLFTDVMEIFSSDFLLFETNNVQIRKFNFPLKRSFLRNLQWIFCKEGNYDLERGEALKILFHVELDFFI